MLRCIQRKAVAIKFIKTDKSDTRKRLKNEIHFCESVDHPNIIKIIDRGYIELQDEAYPFYVMPLYDCSLRKKMKEGIEPATSLSIIMSVLNGISFAHQSQAVMAIACERDLVSGIQDVYPLPAVGVLNIRPNGPCNNTKVDMEQVRRVLAELIER